MPICISRYIVGLANTSDSRWGPSVPVQGTPIQPHDKSFRVYTPYDCHQDILKEKGDNSTSLSRRLAGSNQNRRRLLEHTQFILSLITSLGLIINYEKSDLVPAQVFTFIGMEFHTHTNIVRVPQARQMKILESVRMFSQKTSVSARDFLSLLGQLNAAADLVMLGRLHLRPLQICAISGNHRIFRILIRLV